jgi:Big-like domain-containing protein
VTIRRAAIAALAGFLLALTAGVRLPAQALARRAATIQALRIYPNFYNGQPVVVRAALERGDARVTLVDGDDRLPAFAKQGVGGNGVQEIRGEVWDIGRMAQDDARFLGYDMRAVLGSDLSASWPKPGQVIALNVTSVAEAETLAAPSVRNLALAPSRYVDQRVTVKGQFRGRNLFGDQPQAPPGADGRREFVVRAADASVWVTGKQPKGHGFNFDINSRLDSKRWVEVSGVVKWERGLVSIVAEEIQETSAQAEAAPEQVTVAPYIEAPEVLFSAPTMDETDVPLNAKVRIQFSRDLDTSTIKGHVQVNYSMRQARERGEPEPPPVTARIGYNPGARVMEITFDQPLDRFRIVEIRLTEGIMGTDGTQMKPWTLTFTTGGS